MRTGKIIRGAVLAGMALLFLVGWLTIAAQAQSIARWPGNTAIQVYTQQLNEKETVQVRASVEAWRPFLPPGITVNFAGATNTVQTQHAVTFTRASVPGDERGDCEINSVDGLTTYAVIRIDPRAGSGDEFKSVAEHEFGHALGLQHRAASIMDPRPHSVSVFGVRVDGSARRPGSEDAKILRDIYAVAAAANNAGEGTDDPSGTGDAGEGARVPRSSNCKKYSFRRRVTRGKLWRESTFIFNDKGEYIETDITGSDDKRLRNVPMFEISENPRMPKGWNVGWVPEGTVALELRDRPWFKTSEGEKESGLLFPSDAWKNDLHVRMFDYKLYRTSVNITELDQ
jgi:hypothetical protein